jgi:hypothetical protein
VAEKVSIHIPGHLAHYVRPDTSRDEKMRVVRNEVEASPLERTTLLFFLCYDKDQTVSSSALSALKNLPQEVVLAVLASSAAHPRLLEIIARCFYHSRPIVAALLIRDDLLPATVSFLQREQAKVEAEVASQQQAGGDDAAENLAVTEGQESAEEMPIDEEKSEQDQDFSAESEEFHSKYQLCQLMGVGEKIKMALTGDKEWRSLLIKDSNKLVNGAVVKNPRITEPEILTIAKSVIQNDEILRVICHNKEWVKNYEIRKALVLNNKTPLPVSLRFMATLTEKDLAGMAKSKNISSVLANQARRLMYTKKK